MTLRPLLRDPLPWLAAALLALAFGMPALEPLFAALFPDLDRPLYAQERFSALLASHIAIVAASSAISLVVGVATGLAVTRHAGREFRPLVNTLVAIGQTIPPVAVLALAVPLIGFGAGPALIALALYGLLPIVRATIAGIESRNAPRASNCRSRCRCCWPACAARSSSTSAPPPSPPPWAPRRWARRSSSGCRASTPRM
jgi:osmoprotectant transport system permease protein